MDSPIIHWFRRDLRLTDNTALHAANETGAPIIPVFIFDPAIIESPQISLPRLGFLLKGLEALDQSLRERGSRLMIRRGDPRTILPELVQQFGAVAVYCNRDVTPFAQRRDAEVEAALGVPLHSYDDVFLLPPGSVMKAEHAPYTVFTPFKSKWLTIPKPEMTQTPLQFWRGEGESSTVPILADFGKTLSMPLPDAGETEAERRLQTFLSKPIEDYVEERNRLDAAPDDDTLHGSSFLSPYLRLGMLSPRQAYWGAWEKYKELTANPFPSWRGEPKTDTFVFLPDPRSAQESVKAWVSELIWRDFYGHILFHFPHVLKGSFRPAYDRVAWRNAPDDLAAWKAGMTGYPVVDAAMHQLAAMGWMPNRARMIVASFLTKDLLIHWREGERHFMNLLIDGDPAANNGGWQWSAGTGTDAQPYFRVFNPVSQGEKFDPDGAYVRRWIPELRDVPTKFIHTPHLMDKPPTGYPAPIVEHRMARERALTAFKAVG
ncbi:MAG: DNA photolyase family protein [Anaerolineae bacterium]|nr:DNA photolyase family protein [Anaerolineae bacterium]